MSDTDKKKQAEKYRNDFQKEKYDRIIVNVPKGERDPIKKHAEAHGFSSLNSYIVHATKEQMKRDLEADKNKK